MFTKKLLFAILSLVLLFSVALEDVVFVYAEEDPDNILPVDGLQYFNGNADLALSHLAKIAEEGDVEGAGIALIELGYSYLLGDETAGIKEDPATALRFFEKAEEIGVYAANDILGIFYTYGSIVEQDPTRALEILLEGAHAGYTDCESSIEQYAYSYYSGNDFLIDINFGTAFQYYQALTEFDNPRATYNLGMLYLYGLGVSPDHDKAMKLISESADAGFTVAQEMLTSLSALPSNFAS